MKEYFELFFSIEFNIIIIPFIIVLIKYFKDYNKNKHRLYYLDNNDFILGFSICGVLYSLFLLYILLF